MDDTLAGSTEPAPPTAGERLRSAREAAGLSLNDVALRTRVSLRQLEIVEQGRYDALPSPTYAVGFAKAYARSVGADEVGIAAAVRGEIARIGPRPVDYAPYELPDPARVPSRGLAVVGIGAALAVLILLALWYGGDLFGGGHAGPVAEQTIAAAPTTAAPAVVATPTPAPAPTGGQVRLTANARVWLRVYDADDKTLYLGTMNEGDHFDVPADANGPMVNIGRPDKLTVTLDGRPVAPLGASDHAIKDVKVDGASVAARLAAKPDAASSSAPSPTATPTPAATDDAGATHERREPREASRPKKRVPALTETQRANIEAAATPPAATGNSTR